MTKNLLDLSLPKNESKPFFPMDISVKNKNLYKKKERTFDLNNGGGQNKGFD